MDRKKIVIAGHICLDITPAFEGGASPKDTFVPGRLTIVGAADIHTGGAVANTGLAVIKLAEDRHETVLCGKIGEDDFGRLIMNIVSGYGAGDGMIVSPDVSTSYTVALALPGSDRMFLHCPGANDSFTAGDIPDAALEGAALTHFGYPTLMRRMYLDGGAETVKVLKKIKAAGSAASLDLANVNPESEAGGQDWEAILKAALPYVDIFTPSAEELCFMLDKPRLAEWRKRADGGDVTRVLDIESDIKPLAAKCIDMGAGIVLLKCGKPGMYLLTAGRERIEKISPRAGIDPEKWSDVSLFEQSYTPSRIRSGTGAGDTSIAALLVSMLDGCAPDECLRLASGTGCSCLEEYDSLSGLRSFAELREKIAAGWKKSGEGDL
ncbi:MAG: carbohydrate kinase family protein [Clostridiales bacterium]|nr:carbohydrate kinase family protein [Clostridiales bacterium]